MKRKYLIYGSAAILFTAAVIVLVLSPDKFFENQYPEVENQLHTVLRDQINGMRRDSAVLSEDIIKLKALNVRRGECCGQILALKYDDKAIASVFPTSNDPFTAYDQYQAENNIRSKFFSPFGHVLDKFGLLEETDWFILYEDQATTGLEQFEKNLDELSDKFSGILGENDYEDNLSPDDYYDDEPKNAVVNVMTEKYGAEKFEEKKQEIIAVLSDSSAVLSDIRKQSVLVTEKHKCIDQLRESYKELAATSKDSALLQVALPIFGLIIISLLLIPLLFASRESADPNRLPDDSGVIKNIFANKLILEIFTVFILTITILILGIGDKLSPEVLGTLLGGISIYVLQKTLGQSNSDSSVSNKSNTSPTNVSLNTETLQNNPNNKPIESEQNGGDVEKDDKTKI